MNDNNSFEAFVKTISNWLDSIPPYEYSLYATIIAYLISSCLTTNSQNALGNWLEQVGQIMLTISAQASATPTDDEYNSLVAKVNELEKKLNELTNNTK